MNLYVTHRLGDLIHAPMYRLYRNKGNTIAYIIRECHEVKDIFKYQVVGCMSVKPITIPEECQVLKDLKENNLEFIKETILFEPMFDTISERVKEIYVTTGIPYKTHYFWHPHICILDTNIHKQDEKRA